MIFLTLGAQYEHTRQIRGKFLKFDATEDDMISRNCQFGGQSLLCDNCLKISTEIERLEWKEHGAPFDPLSIMMIPSGICSTSLTPINSNYLAGIYYLKISVFSS